MFGDLKKKKWYLLNKWQKTYIYKLHHVTYLNIRFVANKRISNVDILKRNKDERCLPPVLMSRYSKEKIGLPGGWCSLPMLMARYCKEKYGLIAEWCLPLVLMVKWNVKFSKQAGTLTQQNFWTLTDLFQTTLRISLFSVPQGQVTVFGINLL